MVDGRLLGAEVTDTTPEATTAAGALVTPAFAGENGARVTPASAGATGEEATPACAGAVEAGIGMSSTDLVMIAMCLGIYLAQIAW